MKVSNNENDMNLIAEVPEEQDMEVEEGAEPIINLDTTLTVQNVAKLHEKLKSSYCVHDAIEIDASRVSSIDTATLQLLVALKKDAVIQQKSVVITEPSQRFIESAKLLGVLEILEIDALS